MLYFYTIIGIFSIIHKNFDINNTATMKKLRVIGQEKISAKKNNGRVYLFLFENSAICGGKF